MSNMIQSRAFNLTLEILQGCKFQCVGCMVDKDFDPGPFNKDRRALLDMVDDMKASGYRLREFTIGPVDVIASKAGVEILDHPLIFQLAQRYDSMVLPLALLTDDGLEELCEKVNFLMKGKSFTIATPFPLKSTYNAKHQELINRRVQYVIDHLPDVKFELLYLTVNMTGDSIDQFSVETNQAIHELDFGVKRLVEYVFPHVRKGFDDLMNRSAFLRAFGHFCDVIHACKDTEFTRYLIKPLADSLEATYRSGKLYYTPTLIEKFPIFHHDFVVPKPWTNIAIEQFEEDQYMEQLVNNSNSQPCGDCMHLDRCARGDVQAIMAHLCSTDCLVDMKNRWDLPV